MDTPKRYTITAALPYANGPIHIGHLTGVYIPADIYARYLRQVGKDVLFVCGSDEHGVPITIKAKKEGVSPQQVVDKYHKIIKDSFFDFGISFDEYSRTSAGVHHKTASDFFLKLYKDKKFVEQTSEQLYDAQAGQFLADRFVIGTCPKCGNEESYGDQCEKCGTSHNAVDLINPKSAITGNTPTKKRTKHWFLPLDQYQDFLKNWILTEHKNDWKPNVLGQVKSWIEDGLRPRAVTRDLDWGIPVPIEQAKGKVLYVWFDAPIGYISATKQWAERHKKDWEPYWKDEKTKLVHFIGKDNIVFHCIIFPAMLRAHGNYILPQNVPANEFLNLEGDKISTSKNWAVWLDEYLIDFPEKQDVLRYVLTANAPESKDNNFTWKDFQAKNNNELVAIFGNFINRVSVLTHKYYDGITPCAESDFTEEDEDTLLELSKFPGIISKLIENYHFREASQQMMNIARLGNKYLASQEPWKVIKKDPERTNTIMYVSLQIVAGLSVLCEPFLPFTSAKLKSAFESPDEKNTWDDVSKNYTLISGGSKIGKLPLLFEKIEDEQITRQIQKLDDTKKANQQENKALVSQKDIVEFDDFSKLDIRVGTIISAEKIAKTKKLLRLKIDVGIDIRTVVSGIADSFSPEKIIGQQVSVICNLTPRKIRGVESKGMILTTLTPDGKITLINPRAKSTNGEKIT